jgi:hypothetical protein
MENGRNIWTKSRVDPSTLTSVEKKRTSPARNKKCKRGLGASAYGHLDISVIQCSR